MPLEFPENLKTEIAAARLFIFNTFKKDDPIYFYKTVRTVIATKDPNFLSGFKSYNQGGTTAATETPVKLDFEARVVFLQDQPILNFLGGDKDLQTKFNAPANRVKIQILEEAKAAMSDIKEFEYDDIKYRLDEGPRKLSPFNTFPIYQYIFKREN